MFDSLEPKHLIYGLLRAVLAGVGGWLISHGIVDAAGWEVVLLGIASGLVALIWTVLNKFHIDSKITKALGLPAGANPEQLK